MLRVRQMHPEPLDGLWHRTSGHKGKPAMTNELPVLRAQMAGLDPERGAVVFASDLQGRELDSENRLLGEAVADHLHWLQKQGVISRIRLIVIAGDLYDYPDLRKRGGTGDVDAVWHALSEVAPVVGVMGNHDMLADPDGTRSRVNLLDGRVVEVEDLRVGGVSGIMGNPRRNQRQFPEDFDRKLTEVIQRKPQLIVLHQGPNDPEGQRRGEPAIRQRLETYAGLIVFGHYRSDYDEPFNLGAGQALNVQGRVVICEGVG